MAATAPQIKELRTPTLPQVFQCASVRARKIVHVNVIADRGAIGRRVGISEDGKLAAFPRGGLENIGN